jgi:RimJ/RimL family protein N-acetyltransferase
MTITVRVVAAPELDLGRHTRLQRDAFARRFTLIRASSVQTEAYYAWKYASPAGIARIAQAFDGETLVASVSAVPVRLASERLAMRAWQLSDLATAPRWRRRGLFTSCLTQLLADLGHREPVYCMPNAQSYAALRRAGFTELGRLRLYLTFRFRLNRPAPGRRTPATAPGLGLDLLDAATLDWRFRARPEVSYEMVEIAGPDRGAMFVLRTIGGRERLACAIVGLRMPRMAPDRVIETVSRALGSRSAPVLLTLSQDPPPWRSRSWLIPEFLAPRQFPILAVNFPSETLSFGAAEWDVL